MGCTNSKEAQRAARRKSNAPETNPSPVILEKRKSTTLSKSDSKTELNKDFHEKYKLSVVLGQGSYSVVKQGTRVSDGLTVAVKIVQRKKLKLADELSLRQEVAILMKLNHPNIVQALDFFEDGSNFYFVLEYVGGGELFDRIIERTVYSENDARETARVILGAIKYCHDQGVMHRDIKPENLLLVSRTNDTNLKIADFGFAIQSGGPVYLNQAGTPGYVAPEILENRKYDKGVDMWSVGVIIFMLLGGYHPFYAEGDTQKEMFRKIVTASYSFPDDCWLDVSSEAKDLISKLLCLDPAKRITAAQALTHPWLFKPSTELIAVNLNRSLLLLKSFNTSSVKAKGAQKAGVLAAAAIEAVRKASGTGIGGAAGVGGSAGTHSRSPSLSLKDGAIDVARKLSSGISLQEAAIEVVKKLSATSIPVPASGGAGGGGGRNSGTSSTRSSFYSTGNTNGAGVGGGGGSEQNSGSSTPTGSGMTTASGGGVGGGELASRLSATGLEIPNNNSNNNYNNSNDTISLGRKVSGAKITASSAAAIEVRRKVSGANVAANRAATGAGTMSTSSSAGDLAGHTAGGSSSSSKLAQTTSPRRYSSSRLTPTDPNSYGFASNGAENGPISPSTGSGSGGAGGSYVTANSKYRKFTPNSSSGAGGAGGGNGVAAAFDFKVSAGAGGGGGGGNGSDNSSPPRSPNTSALQQQQVREGEGGEEEEEEEEQVITLTKQSAGAIQLGRKPSKSSDILGQNGKLPKK